MPVTEIVALALLALAAWWWRERRFVSIDELVRAVDDWDSSAPRTAKALQKSLVQHLEDSLARRQVSVLPRFGCGPEAVDVAILSGGERVGIEIQYGLRSAAATRDLLGRLATATGHWDHLVIILCGDVDPAYLRDLKRAMPRVTERPDGGVFLRVSPRSFHVEDTFLRAA